MIIDDEPALRGITAKLLRSRGYKIFEAAIGSEAEEILKRESGKIDLIVSDVIMPGTSGPALIADLQKRELVGFAKILFVSGYSDDKLGSMGFEQDKMNFLEKPYGAATLIAKIRSILDVDPPTITRRV